MKQYVVKVTRFLKSNYVVGQSRLSQYATSIDFGPLEKAVVYERKEDAVAMAAGINQAWNMKSAKVVTKDGEERARAHRSLACK